MHHEKTLESLEPQIWSDLVLESVRRQTIDFAKAKKRELQPHTVYVRSAWSCCSHSLLFVGFVMIS
jgi:hypothetical protein